MCGGSSGAAMDGALRVAKRLGKGKRCVVILPDHASRYLTKHIDDAWMVKNSLADESLLTTPNAAKELLDAHSGPPTVGNTPVELSRGRNEMDCSQMAWSFMAKKETRSDELAPRARNSPTALSRGRNEMDCSHMAWNFMKHKTASPTASPTLKPSAINVSPALSAYSAASGANTRHATPFAAPDPTPTKEELPKILLPDALGLATF